MQTAQGETRQSDEIATELGDGVQPATTRRRYRDGSKPIPQPNAADYLDGSNKELRGVMPGSEIRTIDSEQERAEALSSLRDILVGLS